jgi:hypothetical protein
MLITFLSKQNINQLMMNENLRPLSFWDDERGRLEIEIGNGLYVEAFYGGVQVKKHDQTLVFDSNR